VLAAESTIPTKPDLDGDGYHDAIDSEQQRFVHDDDLDGIINDKDLCPLEPEDYDGDRDADGCPDTNLS
jgi:hypothetical protein